MHASLGIALLQARQIDDAIRELEKAVELNPNDAQAQSSLGALYREKKEFGKAIPHLEQAVMLDPKDAQALSNLGVAYRQTEQDRRGGEVLQEGDRAQAGPGRVPLQPGDGLPAAAEDQRGDRRVREGDQLDPQLAPAHYDLGVMYKNDKRNDDAIREWNLYLDLIAMQQTRKRPTSSASTSRSSAESPIK